jgi:hypothetical protein
MPRNKVQFQKGMSLSEFLEHYGTEAQCEAALIAWRWPQGCRRFRGRRRDGAFAGDVRACCPSAASLQARPAGATAQGHPQGDRA